MVEIRPLRRTDATALGRIEAAAWRDAYQGLLPPHTLAGLKPGRLSRRWSERMAARTVGLWGIEEDGLLVGYCTVGRCADPDFEPGFAGELTELYVHPGWQGRGLGGRLLEFAWQQLRQSGLRWGVLWVLTDNVGGRAFYDAHDLVADGQQRKQRVVGGWVSVTRYARALQPLDLDLVLAGGHG